MRLYTLYAVPAGIDKAEFVMVAPLETIAQYLGYQRPEMVAVLDRAVIVDRTSSTFETDGSTVYRKAGHWMLRAGAILPKPKPVGTDENIGSVASAEELAAKVTR